MVLIAIIEGGIVANSSGWDGESEWIIPPGCLGVVWQDDMVMGEQWPVPESDGA